MTTTQSPYATPPSVLAQIAALPDLSMSDIKSLWKDLFGDDTPTHNRQFLERRIAYRLQEIEFRKVDRALADRNKRRIQTILESGQNKKFDRDIRLMAGTILTREYQGKEYRIMATVDGQYEFEGRLYRSLSRIAKEITGTAWSGPVFFGLKSSAVKKPAGKKGARK
ncbi:DUF2924 domain-containing protein [Burkholderia multivorans]|uniref:DUF2924 domain-containing protein n=1 Tax=Burkholderia multivorans TaxID=87883 RepID=UPI0020199AD2|nr:DUF2924 domain-containing protein [Burkholderia multivorans]MCL4652466.1 DUF2924 domain-containing protein [Burkholderia multivorans]MCL4654305.1 DUF2924 domain-containing protein [Burkholderia multivorans]MCO1426974.1 DUF2924 domain-containing protein [Burkholderia multivorans]UQN53379.1 DUF2924 domain-containing protein [Burkholderia multivorans]UQN82276.1 DUF2924 domain-containing protein [Burkholderia multivorans]